VDFGWPEVLTIRHYIVRIKLENHQAPTDNVDISKNYYGSQYFKKYKVKK